MSSRRHFLGLVAGAFTAGIVPVPAQAADGSWDVSYLWTKSLDSVLDYRELIADALGHDVARDLVVVRGGTGNYGLIYDRLGSSEEVAKRVARTHHQQLANVIGGDQQLATVLPDRGFDRTYHVDYGILSSLEAAKERFDRVAAALGPQVHEDLVIEEPVTGRWTVLYKHYGLPDATAALAATHAEILDDSAVPITAVADRYLDARWAARSAPMPVAAADPTPEPAAPAPRRPPIVTADPPAPAPATPPVVVQSNVTVSGRGELPAAIATPLRDAINNHIQQLRRQRRIDSDETTSWYLHTLNDDRTWAAINAERSLQCASMVKPYVALAFLHQAKKGRIIYGKISRSKLEAMIQSSSNTATNWAMSQLGGPAAVQRILTSNYGDLLRETKIVEAIPTSGRTYRNRSSARDYVRFSRALWQGDLPHSTEIKRLMALPGRDRLTTGAPAIPASTRVMNKTGTTSHLCGDFGILVARDSRGQEVPYAIVGIIEKRQRASNFSSWASSRGAVIRSVSNLAYTVLKDQYALV